MAAFLIKILKEELETRKGKNPAYSMRSFARNLGVSPAQLSQIVSGKRTLTTKTLTKLVMRLNLSPYQKRKCWQSIGENPQEKTEARKTLQLQEDQFHLIADWFHLAILSLCHMSNSKKDPFWISQILGITTQTASGALERLERLGLIAKGKKLTQISNPLNVISSVPSESVRKFHKQVLNLSLDKIDSVDVSLRDYSAIIFPFDPKNMAEVRQRIEQFQEELQKDFQSDKEVYSLSVQFFPLSKKRGSHEDR